MLRTLFTVLCLVLSCLPAAADELAVGDGLVLSYALPDNWTLHTDPPEALVAETAAHVAHEAEALGKHPSPEQLRQVARKRLLANEAIFYHAASGAHLDIDFSRLSDDEGPPTSRTLHKSAEYAAESLENEEGVATVERRIVRCNVSGAREAYCLETRYSQHAEPVTFIGIIGYVARHWFFFYGTVPGENWQARHQLEQLLGSLTIRPVSP